MMKRPTLKRSRPNDQNHLLCKSTNHNKNITGEEWIVAEGPQTMEKRCSNNAQGDDSRFTMKNCFQTLDLTQPEKFENESFTTIAMDTQPRP